MGTTVDAVVEIDGLTIRFGARTVVDGLSLTVRPGERWGLIGESGSGKSLTAAAVAGLLPRHATVGGSVRVRGRELVGAPERVIAPIRGRDVAMMFQDSAVALNPLVRVGVQVGRPLRTLHGRSRAAARAGAQELLAAVGLPPGSARCRPSELSGGQRQRVCLAVALACRARLLVADEPTTALDPSVTREILALLDRSLDRSALLFVSHDLAVVAQLCTRVAVLHRGRIVESGTVAEIVGHPREDHTRDLVAAARLLAPSGERR